MVINCQPFFENFLYDVVFNIRDKDKEQYQYLIEFRELKKKTTPASHTDKDALRPTAELSSNERISQKSDSVNTPSMQKVEYRNRYSPWVLKANRAGPPKLLLKSRVADVCEDFFVLVKNGRHQFPFSSAVFSECVQYILNFRTSAKRKKDEQLHLSRL